MSEEKRFVPLVKVPVDPRKPLVTGLADALELALKRWLAIKAARKRENPDA